MKYVDAKFTIDGYTYSTQMYIASYRIERVVRKALDTMFPDNVFVGNADEQLPSQFSVEGSTPVVFHIKLIFPNNREFNRYKLRNPEHFGQEDCGRIVLNIDQALLKTLWREEHYAHLPP